MASVCMAGTKLCGLGNAKVRVLDRPACLMDMTPIRRVLDLPYTYRVTVHRSCLCNEEIALYNRHLVDRRTKDYEPDWMLQQFQVAIGWVNQQMDGIEPISLLDVVGSYSGAKKRTYARAYHTLIHEGYLDKYSRIQMFVKPDKYDEEGIFGKALSLIHI